jgi:hypothetical protein
MRYFFAPDTLRVADLAYPHWSWLERGLDRAGIEAFLGVLPPSDHIARVKLWLEKEVYPDFLSPRILAPIEPEIPNDFGRSPRTETLPLIATSDHRGPTSPFDKIRLVDDAGEYWSAREMVGRA